MLNHPERMLNILLRPVTVLGYVPNNTARSGWVFTDMVPLYTLPLQISFHIFQPVYSTEHKFVYYARNPWFLKSLRSGLGHQR